MATILVDADDVALWRASPAVAASVGLTPIRKRIEEQIAVEAECYEVDLRPHLLFADWDYAEDWSGEYVREVQVYSVLLKGKPIAEAAWRARLHQVQRGAIRGEE